MRTFFTDLDVLTQINMLKEKIGPDKQYEKGTCDYFEDLQGVMTSFAQEKNSHQGCVK